MWHLYIRSRTWRCKMPSRSTDSQCWSVWLFQWRSVESKQHFLHFIGFKKVYLKAEIHLTWYWGGGEEGGLRLMRCDGCYQSHQPPLQSPPPISHPRRTQSVIVNKTMIDHQPPSLQSQVGRLRDLQVCESQEALISELHKHEILDTPPLTEWQ